MRNLHDTRSNTFVTYIIQFERKILAVTAGGPKQKEYHVSHPLLLLFLTFPIMIKWLLPTLIKPMCLLYILHSNALILTQQTLTTLHLLVPPTLCKMNIPLLSSLQHRHSHEVLKELPHLSPHKASGCTAISNRVLRETAPVIASSLTHAHL